MEPNRDEMLQTHEKVCENFTGQTIEEETINCIVARSGECVRHDFSDATTTSIKCEGCGEMLWKED